jgi:histo-blood group ABO system transferase
MTNWTWVLLMVSVLVVVTTMTVLSLYSSSSSSSSKAPGLSPATTVREEEEVERPHLNRLAATLMNDLSASSTSIQPWIDSRLTCVRTGTIVKPPIMRAIVISLRRTPARLASTLSSLDRIGWAGPVFHFEAVDQPQGRGALGCYLSHLCVLLWLQHRDKSERWVVLEDDFEFETGVTYSSLEQRYRNIDSCTYGRWDRWYWSQYVYDWEPLNADRTVYRVYKGRTDAGYMIHPEFLTELVEILVADLSTKWDRAWTKEDELDQALPNLLTERIFVCEDKSIGYQRINTSTITSFPDADTRWTRLDDTTFRGQFSRLFPLITRPFRGLHPIGICLVATGRYKQFVVNIVRDCLRYFTRPHPLHFFVFTDQLTQPPHEFPSAYTEIYIPRQGFPGDTLYRYHYMLKAEEALQAMSYIFYMDVDYRIARPVLAENVCDDLVAVEHLNNLIGTQRNSFESRRESRAYVNPRPAKVYYAGGFQGGECKHFLAACTTIRDQIDEDQRKGIMAIWHDESHWNAYLHTVKAPTRILNQSYIFDERCLKDHGSYPGDHCGPVQSFEPIMIPLSKNHAEVRRS